MKIEILPSVFLLSYEPVRVTLQNVSARTEKKNCDPEYSLSFITSTWSRGHLTAPVKTHVKCKCYWCYCSFRMFSYLHSEQSAGALVRTDV